ncbi:alkylation response protein AidB-like acyl-CoA dehydrogenase [Spinactinospora alkalitolerans]|uniref:Alkylation response protein AidB-like acyl-CoA dehydrogenase n=1 Tax=Spinactinospora alkalitolerans TaxID=687207 RepID=A0A852U232_9ACTN|nr:acyl-CoA dehydrogenase family protein [Spinactinospora alkalitolerans]NYE48204.1 alkylation response protein AidB-like acyl-CoA dehydrogenase [Spinactinospora alkalitolerans]
MSTGFSAEAEDFGRSVAGVLDDQWGDATAAPSGDLAKLWRTAAEQGWFELAEEGALDFLVTAVRELGRRACPLPLADAYAAGLLLDADRRAAVASGELRPVLALADDLAAREFDHLDAAPEATHVLVVHPDGGPVRLAPITGVEPAPGLAVPPWSRVSTAGAAPIGDADPATVEEALTVASLGLAVRALAAAERAHEMAVEHAKVRRQFGRAIGGFGAVQQRVAACHIEVGAGGALVREAVGHALAASPDRVLAGELAAHHVRETATSIMFGAQHTLGAVGFFEEHEAAWLFRRVHADVARLRAGARRGGGIAEALVEQGRSLPGFNVGPAAEALRAEVRALLAEHSETDEHGVRRHDADRLRAAMAERGLFGIGWPEEAGGRGAGVAEQAVLNEEMKYARGPVDRAMSAVMLLGHSILLHGTPEQKAEFLPLIRRGELDFCLGYSEPESGSDLASLRTRAVRDGDDWIVNGQKSWTTRAHTASHVWLAVRTDPDAAPRHAGITIFLVPIDTPGIGIQRHTALSGEVSCTVFYDDVRVPDTMRVGEVNGGWRVITDALAAERVVMGGIAATLLRQLDDLLAHLRADPARTLGPHGSWKRERLASLAARLQAARALVLAATRAMADGGASRLAAPMAGVLGGELAEDFGQGVLELLGPQAALGADAARAPSGGVFEQALRTAPMFVIGGGTNDVQRAIIARGLGLAREERAAG